MSSIGYGPPERIDGPPPIPPMYGLIPAAEAPLAAGVRIVNDVDDRGIDRWMNGVAVYPYPPDLGDVYDPCAVGSDIAIKSDGDELNQPRFGAMTAYLAETCTTSHVWDQDEYKARAVAALAAVESGIIAHEFLTGTRMPAQPYLSDGNGTFPIGDTITSVDNGLALMEMEIALSRRMGLIHCTPMAATALLGSGFALRDKTGVIRTINGIVVVPDFGYAGRATPVGHAAPGSLSEEWIYATGPVDIRRSEIFVTPDNVVQATDRGSGGATTGKPNSITYRAERYYLVDWDVQVQAAVLVNRCLFTC
jgi:hypothetical protein